MEIWCVKGMFMLKVVSHEKNLGFKGLNLNLTIILVNKLFLMTNAHVWSNVFNQLYSAMTGLSRS